MELLGDELREFEKPRVESVAKHAQVAIAKREKIAFSQGASRALKLLMPGIYAVMVLALFVFGNVGVWYLIYLELAAELRMIGAGIEIERLITSDVLKTLIIATASQTAIAFLMVIRFMYTRDKLVSAEATQD